MSKPFSTTQTAMRALVSRAGELADSIARGCDEATKAGEHPNNENGITGCLMGFENDVAALAQIIETIKTLNRVRA